jgi:hypothetical protein
MLFKKKTLKLPKIGECVMCYKDVDTRMSPNLSCIVGYVKTIAPLGDSAHTVRLGPFSVITRGKIGKVYTHTWEARFRTNEDFDTDTPEVSEFIKLAGPYE